MLKPKRMTPAEYSFASDIPEDELEAPSYLAYDLMDTNPNIGGLIEIEDWGENAPKGQRYALLTELEYSQSDDLAELEAKLQQWAASYEGMP